MERGRSKGPQQRTVTALADALVLEGDARKQFVELARDGPAAGPLDTPGWRV